MMQGGAIGGWFAPATWHPRLTRLTTIARRDTNIVVATVVINNLLRAVSSIVLTRLLVPEAFGIIGVIGSIAFVLAMMSDLGFQAFVVRHRDGDRPAFLDTIWTIAVARSATLCLLLLVAAGPIASLIGKPELTMAIAASALLFLAEGFASLSLFTALRERRILRLSALEVIVAVAQLVVSVALALIWRNYWAMLAAMLAGSVLKTALSYAMFPGSRRRFAFDRAYARELWAFARFVTGSSIIIMLVMQADKLVLARVMPLDSFGFYMLATNLALAPLAFTQAFASRVLYPAYAEAWRQDCADLRALFYARRRQVSLLYMVAAGGLIGSAPLLIAILYDERYAAAGPYLQLLAITPFLALGSSSANEVLTATGRIQVTLQASFAKLAWLAIVGPLGFVTGGPLGLVAAVGTMELPALLLRWEQLRRAHLLRLPSELAFLGIGVGGIALGVLGDAILRPLF